MKTSRAIEYCFFAMAAFWLMFMGLHAFAQVPPSPDEWANFIREAVQLKGATIFAIVTVAVQGLLLIFRSQFAPLSDTLKLAIVSGLTVVATAIGVWNPAISLLQNIGNILFNAQFIAAINVFYHQVFTKVVKAKTV